jgi:hypothetical protein
MHRGWIWRGARHCQSPMNAEGGGDGFTYPQMTARYVHLYTQHGSGFGSFLAAGGAARTTSDVESGDLVSGLIISPSPSALAANGLT